MRASSAALNLKKVFIGKVFEQTGRSVLRNFINFCGFACGQVACKSVKQTVNNVLLNSIGDYFGIPLPENSLSQYIPGKLVACF